MEADAGAHANDEVAEDEGDDFNGVDGMGAKPEQAAYGTGKGDADEEGVGDFLFEGGPTCDDASCGCDLYWLGPRGNSHCVRSISHWSFRCIDSTIQGII